MIDMLFWIMGIIFFLLISAGFVVTAVLIELILISPKHSKERKKRLLILLGFLIGVVLFLFLINYLDSLFYHGIEGM